MPVVHIFASFCDVTITSAEFLAQKMFGYFGSIVYFIIMPGRKFHPCVTAAGSFTVRPSVFPVIPAVYGIPRLRTGSARPYLVVNRILIYSGGLGLPHQQGWGSCSGVLSTLLSGATVFTTSTKREKAIGTVLTGRYGAEYTMFPTLLLNNN